MAKTSPRGTRRAVQLPPRDRERLMAIVTRIRRFDRTCAAQGNTDTGEAWEILREAKAAVAALLRKTAARSKV